MYIKTYKISGYRCVVEVDGNKLILTYNGIKKLKKVRSMLVIVRIAMILMCVAMFSSAMLLGNSIYDLCLSLNTQSSVPATYPLLRFMIGLLVSFFSVCGIQILHDIEESLIKRLK